MLLASIQYQLTSSIVLLTFLWLLEIVSISTASFLQSIAVLILSLYDGECALYSHCAFIFILGIILICGVSNRLDTIIAIECNQWLRAMLRTRENTSCFCSASYGCSAGDLRQRIPAFRFGHVNTSASESFSSTADTIKPTFIVLGHVNDFYTWKVLKNLTQLSRSTNQL